MTVEGKKIDPKELEALKEKAAKADEHWDRILRMTAEYENARKGLEKRSQDSIRYANEQLLLEVLPLVDNLDRAVASLDQGHDLKQVKEGLHLVQNTFHKVLEKHGVEVIPALGQAFDPNRHEAVGEVETDAVEDGHVAEEIQRGYLLNGRVARASQVRIAKPKS